MRHSIKHISITIILTAMAVACSNSFNKNDSNPNLNIQTTQAASETTTFNGDTLVFRPLGQSKFPDEYPPFTSENDNRQIIIHGYYYTSSGFKPVGSFSTDGNIITVRLHAEANDNVAPSIPQGYFYDAYISNLEKGDYTLKIFHENDYLLSKNDEDHTVFTKDFMVK